MRNVKLHVVTDDSSMDVKIALKSSLGSIFLLNTQENVHQRKLKRTEDTSVALATRALNKYILCSTLNERSISRQDMGLLVIFVEVSLLQKMRSESI